MFISVRIVPFLYSGSRGLLLGGTIAIGVAIGLFFVALVRVFDMCYRRMMQRIFEHAQKNTVQGGSGTDSAAQGLMQDQAIEKRLDPALSECLRDAPAFEDAPSRFLQVKVGWWETSSGLCENQLSWIVFLCSGDPL